MNRLLAMMAGAVLALLVVSCATTGAGREVADPDGRFFFQAGEELSPQVEQPGFYRYRMMKEGIDAFVVAEPAAIEEQGVERVLARVGVDPSRLAPSGSTAIGDWRAVSWHDAGADRNVAMAYQVRGGVIYALVASAPSKAMPGDPPGPVMRLLRTLRFTPAAGAAAAPATREELEAAIEKAADARAGGISVAVIRRGLIVYRYAAGAVGPAEGGRDVPAAPGSAFHWGSMTKIVTASAVMGLVEKKLVDLDAPASRYVPAMVREPRITVRMLLDHSAGLPDLEADHLVSFDGRPTPALDEVLSAYLGGLGRLSFTPGSQAEYSNWNYLALGVLIERVTGVPYEKYVTETILRPLGMSHTAFRSRDLPEGTRLANPVITADREPLLLATLAEYRPQEDWGRLITARRDGHAYLADFDILAPWGGLEGTAEDVARFLSMHMDSAPLGRILSASTVAAMARMQRAPNGQPLGWGLGWVPGEVNGEPIIEHAGGAAGVEALMRIYPRRGMGVVVMGNVNDYGSARILSAAADVLWKAQR